MKYSDLLRKKADMVDLVAGTNLLWWECCKINGDVFLNADYNFLSDGDYEFALGIVEGKPVFEGDVLYTLKDGLKIHVKFNNDKSAFNQEWARTVSWNPPAPKTITINGKEYPAPDDSDSYFGVNINGKFFSYKESMEAVVVTKALWALMEGK